MVKIRDHKSATEWLKDKQHEVQVAFAARCALRTLPETGLASEVTQNDITLLVLRAVLTSGVAAVCPSPDVRKAAAAAAAAAADAAFATKDSAIARSTAAAAADAVYNVALLSANSGSLAESAAIAADSAASADATTLNGNKVAHVFRQPLWPTGPMPEGLQEALNRLHAFWDVDPTTWGFWRDWYQGMLDGAPLDWTLQERIALIPNAEWKKGAKRIAGEIKKVEDHFWDEALPQHETLTKDSATGKFSVNAAPFDEAAEVGKWLKQVKFAVDLAVDSNTSDFNRMCTAYKYIRHTLDDCRDDPNAIEQQFGIAIGIIEKNLDDPKYEADDSLEALCSVLRQIQVQMRADHPKVRKAWEKRIAQKLREVDKDTKLRAAEAIRAETGRTEGRLSTEMELDSETVENADSVEAQANALRRAGGRAAKMNVLDRTKGAVEGIDKSSGYKAVRIGTTGYTVGDIVWMLKELLSF